MTPPQSGLDIFNVKESDFFDLKTSDLIAGKWLGRTLGLPKKYVEGIFEMADIDSKKIGKDFSDEEIKKIFDTTKKIVIDVISGNHDPVIIRNDKSEVRDQIELNNKLAEIGDRFLRSDFRGLMSTKQMFTNVVKMLTNFTSDPISI